MSYTTYGQQGLDAAKAKDWPKAIDLLSRGLAAGTAPPQWLLARAHAFQETGQLARALADAERAYLSALTRQHPKQRDHLFQAQYRRAIVLGHLRRYADADACCVWAQQLIEGKNFRKEDDDVAANVDADGTYLATPETAAAATAKMPRDKEGGAPAGTTATGSGVKGLPEWAQAYSMRTVLLRAMQGLPEGDPGRKLTVKRVPDPPQEEEEETKETEEAKEAKEAKEEPKAASTPAPPPPKKLRVDFYQTPDTVSLSLYAKGVQKEDMKVDVQPTQITIAGLPESVAATTTAHLLLGGSIDPATQDVRVTPYKIELKFRKSPAGVKWGDWGSQADAAAPTPTSTPTPTITASPKPALTTTTATTTTMTTTTTTNPTTQPTIPAYPTSSRRGPKNWDAVVSNEDDAPADGDVNGFFKQLFASSTPEQQRAMIKSFTESNGTALSTDWEKVAKETVETKPPEGVEAKKWGA